MQQSHGSKTDEVIGPTSRVYNTDGLYTRQEQITLAVRSADCLPILFFAAKRKIIGVIHAGWRGTSKEILYKAVRKIMTENGVKPEECYFFFGPGARPCCYEVSEQLAKKFSQKNHEIKKIRTKYYLDIPRSNLLQLARLQVPQKNIEDCGICTIHNKTYPSHRREGEKRHSLLFCMLQKIPANR